jgi:ABC-type multidrug transport system ATPase subunit
MEEAEALCGRIGIMAKGTLRCLANPNRLKDLYGSGFRLFFNSLEENTEKASRFVESLLPKGWKKVDSFATNVSYEFPPSEGAVSRLFNYIEAGKETNGILDWGLGQTTLEEVFIRLISESDAQADY